MTHNTTGIPARNSAAYKAGEHLYKNGPKPEAELFGVVSFGTSAGAKACRLQDAIITGWLTTTPAGLIACADLALDHFDGKPEKYVGSTATSCQINMLARPEYKTPKRVMRADVPAWSLRPVPNFHRG